MKFFWETYDTLYGKALEWWRYYFYDTEEEEKYYKSIVKHTSILNQITTDLDTQNKKYKSL
jgi:hypothetical protein